MSPCQGEDSGFDSHRPLTRWYNAEIMITKDQESKADFEAKPDRPLKEITLEFLQKFRSTDEFRYGYNLGNRQFMDPDYYRDEGEWGARWKRRTIFVQKLASKLFGVQTIGEVTRLLEPWKRWDKIHQEIWRPYWRGDHGGLTSEEQYKKLTEEFMQVPVPDEIREYQGDLTDEDLKPEATEIIWMAREIGEAISILEGSAETAPLGGVFRVQRVLGKPVKLVGGLETEVTKKPSARCVIDDGSNCIFLDFDEESDPWSIGMEEPAKAEWDRWVKLEIGSHVKYLRENRETHQLVLESGTICGFHLLGAGEEMIFAPSLGAIGVITINDRSGFYECALVREIRLDNEEFSPEELAESAQPEPVELTTIIPSTGEVSRQTFSSMDEASGNVVKRISRTVDDPGGQDVEN